MRWQPGLAVLNWSVDDAGPVPAAGESFTDAAGVDAAQRQWLVGRSGSEDRVKERRAGLSRCKNKTNKINQLGLMKTASFPIQNAICPGPVKADQVLTNRSVLHLESPGGDGMGCKKFGKDQKIKMRPSCER